MYSHADCQGRKCTFDLWLNSTESDLANADAFVPVKDKRHYQAKGVLEYYDDATGTVKAQVLEKNEGMNSSRHKWSCRQGLVMLYDGLLLCQ